MMITGINTRFCGAIDTKASNIPFQDNSLTIKPTVNPIKTPFKKSSTSTSGSPMTDNPSAQMRIIHLNSDTNDCQNVENDFRSEERRVGKEGRCRAAREAAEEGGGRRDGVDRERLPHRTHPGGRG